jgi:glycosyltransferase involved in cell wall biosynthesis
LKAALNILCHLDSRFGGLSSTVPGLARATASNGRYSGNLLALVREDEIVPEAETGVNVKTFPLEFWRGIGDLRLAAWMRPLIENADVVHVHGIWRQHCAIATRMAACCKTPLVVSAHGMLQPSALHIKHLKKAIYSALIERGSFRRAGCMRALTRFEAEEFRGFGLRNHVAVIPNGIEIPTTLNADCFYEKFPELRDRRLVLFLGRLHFAKGLDILCQSWARVFREFRDWHLVVVGPDDGNTKRSIQALVSELGMDNAVTFAGILRGDLKWGALAASQLFVLPSQFEGFSTSILEAMGVGLPVIITRQCHFPEVADRECGWVIERDVEGLTCTLREALSLSESAARQLGANGAALVRTKYSWRNIGEQMADVYDWLLGGNRPDSVEFV